MLNINNKHYEIYNCLALPCFFLSLIHLKCDKHNRLFTKSLEWSSRLIDTIFHLLCFYVFILLRICYCYWCFWFVFSLASVSQWAGKKMFAEQKNPALTRLNAERSVCACVCVCEHQKLKFLWHYIRLFIQRITRLRSFKLVWWVVALFVRFPSSLSLCVFFFLPLRCHFWDCCCAFHQ